MEKKWDKKHREGAPWASCLSPASYSARPLHLLDPWLPHRCQGGLGGQRRVRAGLAAAGELECFPDLLAKHQVGEEDAGALAGKRQQL